MFRFSTFFMHIKNRYRYIGESSANFTHGKTYDILENTRGAYVVEDDTGKKFPLEKERFLRKPKQLSNYRIKRDFEYVEFLERSS